MIRTSKLSTKFANKGKQEKTNTFVDCYQIVTQDFIEILWKDMSDDYEVPKYVDTKSYARFGFFQRIIKCCSDQASGVVRSITAKIRKQIKKLRKKCFDEAWIQEKVKKPTKPNVMDNPNFKCELNSIVCDWQQEDNFWFLQLKSIGIFDKFRIPFKIHRQTKKWIEKGTLMTSVLLSKTGVDVRFKILDFEPKTEGITLGLDEGITTCVALSDGQVTKPNKDGYDLAKIMNVLKRRKKGSKNFKQAQDHRLNYIGWSINQLNLTNVKEIKIEKLDDVRRGKPTDRFRSHWTYPLIVNKAKRFCEENKVCFSEQDSTYRSQRCFNCGLVYEKNRKGKDYKCRCGYHNDADVNGALNHTVDLPDVSMYRGLGYNLVGFYWLKEGIYGMDGEELPVPHKQE